MGLLDMFLPGGANLSPDQMSAAGNRGLLNASLALIDASSNHYGLRPSTMQVLGQGVRGYGQGVGDYASTLAGQQSDLAKGQMAQINAQRALQYFYPQGKGNNMAAALAPQPQGGLSDFYGSSIAQQAIPPLAGSPVGAGYGETQGGQFPPSPPGGAQPTSLGAQTAFGSDVPTMARSLYKMGWDQLMAQQPGGDALIKEAIAMDPSIIASSESAKMGADYPYELGKIGATGAQARQTEGYKAGITPMTQTVMIDGVPTQIATNNLAAATGQLPSSAYPMPQAKPDLPMPMPGQKPRLPPPGAGAFGSTTTAPVGAGAGNVPLENIPQVPLSALQPPAVSTSVPVGAQQKAEALATQAAQTTMSAQDVTNKANDMRLNIAGMINTLKDMQKLNGTGSPAKANVRAWAENHSLWPNNDVNDAYAQLEQLGSGTLLPSIKEYLQGTGQVRVFEGQNLQKMFEFDRDQPISSNIKKLEQSLPQIDRMEQGAMRNLGAAKSGQVQPVQRSNPQGAPTIEWLMKDGKLIRK